MRKTRTMMLAALILCVAASIALGAKVWYWTVPYLIVPENSPNSMEEYYLTGDNGSHSVAMTKYSDGTKLWTSILAAKRPYGWNPDTHYVGRIQAYEYKDIGNDWRKWNHDDLQWPFAPSEPGENETLTVNCHVANNSLYKTYTWGNLNTVDPEFPAGYGIDPPSGDPNLGYQGSDWWDSPHDFSAGLNDSMAKDMGVAVAMFKGPNDAARSHGVAVWVSEHYDSIDLRRAVTTNGGATWPTGSGHDIVYIPASHGDTWWRRPSLATDDLNGANAYLAYESTYDNGNSASCIVFRKSTDWGDDWNQSVAVLGRGMDPSVAAAGQFVFVSWTRFIGQQNRSRRILYRFSTDAGTTWAPDTSDDPDTIPFAVYSPPNPTNNWWFRYENPNVAAVPLPDQTHPGILVVARLGCHFDGVETSHWWTVRGMFASVDGDSLRWVKLMPLSTPFVNNTKGEPLNPSIAAVTAGGLSNLPLPVQPDAIATCVMSTPAFYRQPLGYGHHIRKANGYYADRPHDPAPLASTARLLALEADGTEHYGCASWPYIATGQVFDGVPIYDFGANGKMPALATDADGFRWVAYVEQDTLWCYSGYGDPTLVFAGSTSAVPGQPSIVCYPNAANGQFVANVVFATYDTAGGTSKIMYCRVDTSQVVVDTIESVANLGDSLPAISVYATDTLLVTYQHGDSVLSTMLADYGPGTSGRPSAWSNPSLVTATGYHPMSVMENGSVLNCTYTAKSGSNYSVERSCCDLSGGGMFGSWTGMASPCGSTSYQTGNPVYAGVGVSVFQQKDVTGNWIIKGFVRGEETTLVANDTDAYHPQAVAESLGSSPSVDLIRLHLLYDAGVAIEVDSGVFDTGEVRYEQFDFPTSHAGANATRLNNGTKLLRKNGSDSLYAVYGDVDGAVAFAWSAAGDSWRREIMTTGRDYPAIAEDSSGKRWVVTRKPSQTMNPPIQEAYYRNGSSWTGPETLYAVSGTTLGPASLSGSSYATSGIAYAAFLSTANGGTKSLILAKFNGSVVSTYTVATGSSLGDPALTVEPYKSDSDRIHITWEDGTIKYRMNTDGRSTSIASNWTSTYSLTDGQSPAHHPYISADHDQIVAAWAQGATADIYSSKRSTSSAYNNWDAAVNLSNTGSYASDYPTIAMGDTVVVAWEETRSGNDHDIMVCINFSDTLNIADNTTVSGYPHVLFYNKASGDTAIPYLHTIWSETPEANYYEVGYNKLNLKQASGEGQQSASSIPIPVKPALASCSPNPFRNHTRISYALPSAGNVSLRVYDVTGRTVRTLASGHQKAGSYAVSWDAKDSHGKQVPYGVYFYRLDTPGFRSVKKAVVNR